MPTLACARSPSAAAWPEVERGKSYQQVHVHGRSWKLVIKSVYCFEVTVDGEPSELHVAEEIAFDLLGAFTMNDEKCLQILRLHRSDLAKNLERKLDARGVPDSVGFHFLSLDDIDRTNPVVRDRERSKRSEIDKSSEE